MKSGKRKKNLFLLFLHFSFSIHVRPRPIHSFNSRVKHPSYIRILFYRQCWFCYKPFLLYNIHSRIYSNVYNFGSNDQRNQYCAKSKPPFHYIYYMNMHYDYVNIVIITILLLWQNLSNDNNINNVDSTINCILMLFCDLYLPMWVDILVEL